MSADGDPVSPQWRVWRETVDLDEYEARFVHDAAHGEADLVESLGATSVLDAGCGTGRVAVELHRRGLDVVGVDLDPDLLAYARAKAPDVRWEHADLAQLDLGRRFDVVAMPGNVMLFCRASDRPAVVARCAAHLAPGGALVAGFALRGGTDALTLAGYDAYCAAAGLVLESRWSTWDREPFRESGRGSGGDTGGYAVSVHRRR